MQDILLKASTKHSQRKHCALHTVHYDNETRSLLIHQYFVCLIFKESFLNHYSENPGIKMILEITKHTRMEDNLTFITLLSLVKEIQL